MSTVHCPQANHTSASHVSASTQPTCTSLFHPRPTNISHLTLLKQNLKRQGSHRGEALSRLPRPHPSIICLSAAASRHSSPFSRRVGSPPTHPPTYLPAQMTYLVPTYLPARASNQSAPHKPKKKKKKKVLAISLPPAIACSRRASVSLVRFVRWRLHTRVRVIFPAMYRAVGDGNKPKPSTYQRP